MDIVHRLRLFCTHWASLKLLYFLLMIGIVWRPQPSSAELVLHAEAVQDTFLTHESVFVKVMLINESEIRFPLRPFIIGPEFVDLEMIDKTTQDTLPDLSPV